MKFSSETRKKRQSKHNLRIITNENRDGKMTKLLNMEHNKNMEATNKFAKHKNKQQKQSNTWKVKSEIG